ncbi:hypothetical protein M8J77_019074 [Diaphorina citri]|nr:hypothetical protein M8J77_019074 [Diaphorina citri]
MLKYLTQKLQNSAITEEVQQKKVQIDEDQDSGTESDDNLEDEDMDSPSPILIGEVTSTSSPYFSDNSSHRLTSTDPILDEADILYDPHSSEEELEVINNISGGGSHSNSSSRVTTTLDSPLLPVPSLTGGASTKRKWSQVNASSSEDLDEYDTRRTSRSSLSSDEEVTGLFSITPASSTSVPLQFRTSPPVNVLKPGGQRLLSSPPVKSLYAADSISPRKKSRPSPSSPSSSVASHYSHHSTSTRLSQSSGNHIQRPCLDFEKMQQMKARAVTSWRHGGELSVFCW